MNKGFMLVELIVIIVVVAILCAVAIPKFVEAGRKARMVEDGATSYMVTMWNDDGGVIKEYEITHYYGDADDGYKIYLPGAKKAIVISGRNIEIKPLKNPDEEPDEEEY